MAEEREKWEKAYVYTDSVHSYIINHLLEREDGQLRVARIPDSTPRQDLVRAMQYIADSQKRAITAAYYGEGEREDIVIEPSP